MTQLTNLGTAGVSLLVGAAAAFGYVHYQRGQNTALGSQPSAPSMRSACGKDLMLCRDVEPGGDRIVQCLLQLQADLSDSCRSFLQGVKTRRSAQLPLEPGGERIPDSASVQHSADNPSGAGAPSRIVAACGQDMQKFCGGVEPGQGRKVRCLLDRKTEISGGCTSYLQQLPAGQRALAPR